MTTSMSYSRWRRIAIPIATGTIASASEMIVLVRSTPASPTIVSIAIATISATPTSAPV